MPYHFDFDPVNRILRCRVEGVLGEEVLKECYAVTRKYLAIALPNAGVFDLSAVTSFEISARTVRLHAELPPAVPDPSLPRFIVAPNDTIFGMARMFQLLGETTRPNLHVVRSLGEVYSILGVSSAQFEPLDLLSPSAQAVRPKIAG